MALSGRAVPLRREEQARETNGQAEEDVSAIPDELLLCDNRLTHCCRLLVLYQCPPSLHF